MVGPLAYIGGKNRVAAKIIALLPEHTTYVEPFAGGAQVFFHKRPSEVEVLNDLDGEIVNLLRVCQWHHEELVRYLKFTVASRSWFDLLAKTGASLVVETLAGLAAGTVHPRLQNHHGATYAPLLDREDGRMDFSARSAHELYNRWRGFQPWPGAFTTLEGKKLIVHRLAVVWPNFGDLPHLEPGRICIENHRLYAACAKDTWLEFLEVQLEGKKRLPAAEFLRGSQLPAGARLGSPTP